MLESARCLVVVSGGEDISASRENPHRQSILKYQVCRTAGMLLDVRKWRVVLVSRAWATYAAKAKRWMPLTADT